MATATRKARKRARREAGYGVEGRFQHPVKHKTPLHERAFVTQPVLRKAGDALPKETMQLGYLARSVRALPRSMGRVRKFIESGGIKR